MSSDKRGRALLISNAYSSCPRTGSEHDFNNLRVMFGKFHFDVVGGHKDYTARVKFAEYEIILRRIIARWLFNAKSKLYRKHF